MSNGEPVHTQVKKKKRKKAAAAAEEVAAAGPTTVGGDAMASELLVGMPNAMRKRKSKKSLQQDARV